MHSDQRSQSSNSCTTQNRTTHSRISLPAPPQVGSRRGLRPFRAWAIGLGLALGTLAVATAELSAQLPQARLTAVFPAGGQRGTAVDLTTISGTDLDELSKLYFSHPGITAAPKTTVVDGQPRPVPGQFTVTIAADVPTGVYDVRAVSLFGLSNPRSFMVGDRKEVLEIEPNNTSDKPMPVELNTLVNGRSDGATDLDYYKFSGKAGQRILADCWAQRLDSRMDAVLELYSSAGRKLATSHNEHRHDALLDYRLPADGDYTLKVYDFVFGGGADYMYRLSIHTGPHIDYVLPASGVAGTTAEYTLFGRNLPGGQPSPAKIGRNMLDQLKVQITLPADATVLQPAEGVGPAEAGVDGISYTLASPAGASNPATIYFSSSPVAVEAEPNDTPEQAQKLTLPVEVSGQFQARGDSDWYTFDAKPGDVWWIEAYGQRNGTAADPYLVIEQVGKKNEKGEQPVSRITALDDNPLNIGGTLFNTISDDPVFRFAAPAEATYRVLLRDRYFESRGDPRLTYRLSIRKETPDFRLAALPPCPTTDPNQMLSSWELGLRKGDNGYVNVMAFRRDGYNGTIDLSVEGLPAGVVCPGASIGPGQASATLVISSTEQAADWFGTIRIIGKGRIEDAATVKAVADAEAAKTAAVAALPPLDKAVADTAAAAKAAADKAAAAKAALDKDAKNEALIKANAEAAAAATKAADAAKAAADAKAAGEKKIADATAAIASAQAARDKATREIAREARGGTIVWPGVQTVAPQARVARSVTLSVLKEPAPYQLLSDVSRVDANQSRQILVSMKLVKRLGFDNNVTLTFVTPPPNILVENKPIEKGKTDQVYRIFVQPNAAPGVYTLFVQTQAQVPYSRNPEAAALAVKEKEAADKAASAAAEALKKATDAKTASDKKATDTDAAAKAAVVAKTAADKLAADTDAAAKAAVVAKTAADKLATDTDAAAKAAVVEKTNADKLAADTAAAAKAAAEKAAAAKAASDKAPNDKALADAKVAAEKAATEADAAAKKAADAKVISDKKAADTAVAAKQAADAKVISDKKAVDTADAAKKAADAKIVADKAATDTAALAKAAADEKAASDKLLAEATQKNQAAVAAKAAADKKATDTANVSKPTPLNTFYPTPSITINVKQGPGTLNAAPAGGGALKRGAKLEVKVTVARANGFTGPVTLSLPLPPGVTGLTAPEVVIPADKNEGTLVIQAAGDATLGQLTNMVVRGSMEFNGPAAVDQPVAINVTQ